MAQYKYTGYKRPKNTKKTLLHLLGYLGHHKWLFLLVGLLVCISTGANLMGTYLLKPVINRFIMPGDMSGLSFVWGACTSAALWPRWAITS